MLRDTLRRLIRKRLPLIGDALDSIRRLSRRIRGRQSVFTAIYRSNRWGDDESVSGTGSNLERTAVLRAELPRLLDQLGIRSLLDAPCGDYNWMSTLNLQLDHYVGVDIVQEIVQRNHERYAHPTVQFFHRDITQDSLPDCDLILCRDCLVHLSNDDVVAAIRNFAKTGAAYLLTTTFPTKESNPDIPTGSWRPINLQASPFQLPAPITLIDEQLGQIDSRFPDKHLGLWRLADLRVRFADPRGS